MTKILLLASSSTHKINLLKQLQHPFQSFSPEVDETPYPGEDPAQLAQRLATLKAVAGVRYLADRYPDDPNTTFFCIGGDQVISLNDTLFHKPETTQNAIQQLLQLQGKTHQLLCAISLAKITPQSEKPQIFESLTEFKMEMRALSHQQIVDYIHLDQPLSCAGSYKIESAGIKLFSNIEGPDYTAIIGLPLTRVETLLIEAQFYDPLV